MRRTGPSPAWFDCRDARGVSTVELALLMPILMVVLAGSVDVARLISTKLRLQQAAERTAEMASAGSVGSAAFTSLQAEAASAASVPATQVTVTYWLECDGTKQTTFDGTCGSGQQVGRFAAISIASSYKPSFSWLLQGANGDGSIALTGRASVRVQ
jgi:Flp pilus assembly protein TadG